MPTCTITVSGPGYQHSETQKWQLKGPTSVHGSFQFVPSQWTDTGSGSSHVTQGDQSRRHHKVDREGRRYREVPVRRRGRRTASSSSVKGNAQLRVQDGVTGIQKLTIAGVEQTPGPVGLEAFETQFPPIVTSATRRTVSGSMPPTTVVGSFGPFQPGAATATKSCSWRFSKAP